MGGEVAKGVANTIGIIRIDGWMQKEEWMSQSRCWSVEKSLPSVHDVSWIENHPRFLW